MIKSVFIKSSLFVDIEIIETYLKIFQRFFYHIQTFFSVLGINFYILIQCMNNIVECTGSIHLFLTTNVSI
jgi:hypothetical protein